MRYLSNEIERLFAEEQKMCFIAGPRQVGKTTLAKKILAAAKPSAYYNWDIDSDRRLIVKYPEDFWKRREPIYPQSSHGDSSRKLTIALDEIHKFPRSKRFLKGLFDAHGLELQILVTGSGKLDVYQRGGDSLFGKYYLYHLHPFTVGEVLTGGGMMTPSPDTFIQRIQRAPIQAVFLG